MKLKNYAAFAAITLAGATSSQAALVLTNGTMDHDGPLMSDPRGTVIAGWTDDITGEWELKGDGNHYAATVGTGIGVSDSMGTILAEEVGSTIDINFDLFGLGFNHDVTVTLLFDGVAGAGTGGSVTVAAADIPGTRTQFSIDDYTVAAGDVGAEVTVQFQGGGGGWAQVGIDNVVLTQTPVPEPSSAALLGLGGLALILRRRK